MILYTLLFFLIAFTIYRLNNPKSPLKSVLYSEKGKNITISYSSPSKKGRLIFSVPNKTQRSTTKRMTRTRCTYLPTYLPRYLHRKKTRSMRLDHRHLPCIGPLATAVLVSCCPIGSTKGSKYGPWPPLSTDAIPVARFVGIVGGETSR